ncbi:MAG: glycerophosphodiester phosphodiesterase family protein [Actinomycetia bacterium]|nr:glycerophosphodiester phosphodiesterase family protein [Actinomycetes bacterium]
MTRAADFAYFQHDGPLALAHRGGTLYEPNAGIENSLRAFRHAAGLGYRYIETDVHASIDGTVWAFHDTHLDRATDATGAVATLPYAAVAEARIGGTEPIPTLAQVLEEFPEARLNIDIKADCALQPTLDVLRAHGALDRVCVASFSHRRLQEVRRRVGPHVATSASPPEVARLRFGAPLTRLLRGGAVAFQIPEHHRLRGRTITLLTPGLIAAAHRAGKQVHVWFHDWEVEDAATHHRLLDLGVDGIVSDRIEVLAQVLAERGHPLSS